jgi:drug/metabolite transporter (DMT)-like permease
MFKKPLFQLHIAVFLFGFTAILGKLLSIQEYSLVWWRMLIASLVFLVFPGFFPKLRALSTQQILRFLGIGVLVAVHWITFYGSIKVGNSASLTLVCFGLTASFTSLIEPWVLGQRVRKPELLLGLVAFLGIYFIYLASPQMEIPSARFNKALLLGVFSSFVAALFSSLNAKYIKKADSVSVTFLELGGGFLFVSLLFLVNNNNDFQLLEKGTDWIWMLLLTVVCTNFAFALNLQAMKHISAFTANIAINLEPIYGMLLAAVFFHENKFLTASFYQGAAIILATVFLHPLLNRYSNKLVTKKTSPAKPKK